MLSASCALSDSMALLVNRNRLDIVVLLVSDFCAHRLGYSLRYRLKARCLVALREVSRKVRSRSGPEVKFGGGRGGRNEKSPQCELVLFYFSDMKLSTSGVEFPFHVST